MAIFGVEFCLSVLIACIIVSTPFVQGRSLRRRHGHHSHSDYYNLDESLPRDLSRRLEDDLEHYRDFHGQTKIPKLEYPQVLDRSSEYEDSEDRVSPSFRRYKHEYDSRGRESLRRKEDSLHDDFNALSMRFVRRKRYNKHDSVTHQKNNEPSKINLKLNARYDYRVKLYPDKNDEASFELEVKEAQNRSVCNYTVESIPDTRGSRVPKNLEHVRCNHIGSSCQGTGTYCCIQTYRNIEVSYGNGDKETMKLYVGCVCALQVFNNIQEPRLPIND